MSGESRPSARTLSQVFMKGKDGMGSIRNRTAIATFFGKKTLKKKFWCAPFGYLLMNTPGLGAGIDPGMALTPYPSSNG